MNPHFVQMYRVTGTHESIPVGIPSFDWFSPVTRLISEEEHFVHLPDDFMSEPSFYFYLRTNVSSHQAATSDCPSVYAPFTVAVAERLWFDAKSS
jgi:hypothetical protein